MKPFGLEGAAEYDGGEGGGVPGSGSTGDAVTGVNVIDINPAHQLLCFGTETRQGRGTVEMWDPRSRSRAGILRLPYASLAASSMSSATLQHPRLPGVDDDAGMGGVAVTSLANRNDGLNLAVGRRRGMSCCTTCVRTARTRPRTRGTDCRSRRSSGSRVRLRRAAMRTGREAGSRARTRRWSRSGARTPCVICRLPLECPPSLTLSQRTGQQPRRHQSAHAH